MRGRVWFRPFAGTLLFVYAAACYHYVPTGQRGPEAYIAQKEPLQVRVTLTDSSQRIVYDPWITADSIGGRLGPSSKRPAWSAPRVRVARIEAQRMKVVPTLLIVGIPVILAVGAFAVVVAWAHDLQ